MCTAVVDVKQVGPAWAYLKIVWDFNPG